MAQPTASAQRGATLAVVVLTAMNLLNYIDRYLPSAVKDLFKVELQLSDAETSYPLTVFVIVYMLASPVFGSLSDRWPRKVVIAVGVALWSLATAAAAFATGFWTFLCARALVGVGEAAYATITPSLISDFYPPTRRNRALTFFYVAIPVGAAIGFAAGGLLGQHFGWRLAFLACGLPGLAAAATVLAVRDPGRGTFDTDKGSAPPPWSAALRMLASNRKYVCAVGGYVLVTFASGALADWFPAYLARLRGMDLGEAGSIVGTATVIGGLGGTVAGGLLADRLEKHTRNPYFALSGLSMACAAGLSVVALQVHGTTAIIAAMVAAQFCLWCYNGPINATLVNCVPSGLRARAFSLSILCIHLFGDAISPPIVGGIADATGSLRVGIALVPITLAAGALVWLRAWRKLAP